MTGEAPSSRSWSATAEVVAVLGGTGALGYGLAVRLAHAGYAVAIGSRDQGRAEAAAARLAEAVPSADARGLSNPEAVRAADRLVVLSVPLASQVATIQSVTDELLLGKILLDATVPLAPTVGGRPTQVVGLWSGSAGQQAAAGAPEDVPVVSGLHTLSAAVLEDLDHALDQDTLICGDTKAAKEVVKDIIGAIDGLRVVDAGKLEASRLVECLTPLLIGINIRNKTHAGVRIVGLG
jgi:8-hydroxy-5-deazaflavin:NADPH oxidoreductase